jgi:hypothetical protein
MNSIPLSISEEMQLLYKLNARLAKLGTTS